VHEFKPIAFILYCIISLLVKSKAIGGDIEAVSQSWMTAMEEALREKKIVSFFMKINCCSFHDGRDTL